MRIPSEQQIERLRKSFEGKRIRCKMMPQDPRPIPPGTEGTCDGVDGMGQLLMKWDNGSTLSLIPGVDSFEIIKTEEAVA